MKTYENINDKEMKDNILKPSHRFSVYGTFDKGNNAFHKSFRTYQQALDFYTKVRDEGAEDLMLDDNVKKENLANNEL